MKRKISLLLLSLVMLVSPLSVFAEEGLSQAEVTQKILESAPEYFQVPMSKLDGTFEMELRAGTKDFIKVQGTTKGQTNFTDPASPQFMQRTDYSFNLMRYTYDKEGNRTESPRVEEGVNELYTKDNKTYQHQDGRWSVNDDSTTFAEMIDQLENMDEEDKQQFILMFDTLLSFKETEEGYVYFIDPAKEETYYQLMNATSGSFNIESGLSNDFTDEDRRLVFKKIFALIKQMEVVVDKDNFMMKSWTIDISADQDEFTDIISILVDQGIGIPIPYEFSFKTKMNVEQFDQAEEIEIPEEGLAVEGH